VAAEVGAAPKVVISILAAVSTDRIASAYPEASIYRFIPNIPTEVQRGVLGYVAGPRAEDGPEDEILELMGRSGTVIRLDDEPLIEPAMALMACGPAFMALVAETFAEAGAAHGLDQDVAMRMVVETMGGTADYLARHDYDGPDLRRRVATPGGTTERGLIVLEERGLRDVTRAAVDAVVEATR
jgi:pyrroline-5-carboxylate reductase